MKRKANRFELLHRKNRVLSVVLAIDELAESVVGVNTRENPEKVANFFGEWKQPQWDRLTDYLEMKPLSPESITEVLLHLVRRAQPARLAS
ncbi:MAG TPA: hypothetical protein VG734_25555 [Lacunisphaera sp.]|nr:hypothetical protein [Lacunisphaera sp.]